MVAPVTTSTSAVYAALFSTGRSAAPKMTSQALWPVIGNEQMIPVLSEMRDAGIVPKDMRIEGESDFINGTTLLEKSAHIVGTLGSPGTILMVPTLTPNNYEVIIASSLGTRSSATVRLTSKGWENDKKGTYYSDFQALTRHLLERMEGVLGDELCYIPFLTHEQIEAVLMRLNDPATRPGTYVCFAHAPMLESPSKELLAPGSRNVFAWKTPEGKIEQAYFHYDYKIRQWLNGGPNKPMDEAAPSHGAGEGITDPVVAARASPIDTSFHAEGETGGSAFSRSPMTVDLAARREKLLLASTHRKFEAEIRVESDSTLSGLLLGKKMGPVYASREDWSPVQMSLDPVKSKSSSD